MSVGPIEVIVVEFPDRERAHAWYRSPEYAAALEVRDKALSRNLILVDGVPPGLSRLLIRLRLRAVARSPAPQ